ncbi:Enterobacteria AfaD invasin protein [Cedecea neteri]|uniref:Enterobacteria AfaD invasin protein n=1 Tax=Cedecea neteri TaxID=158822 RepID=A0A2X2SXZ9_9ENTR|nr:Enterobacteria AfaD invasin protein [Cedecea neteri]
MSGQFSCRGKHHIWLNAEKVDDVANTYIVRGKHNQGNIIYVTLGGQGWIVDDSAEKKRCHDGRYVKRHAIYPGCQC